MNGLSLRARKRPSAILIHVEDAINNFFLLAWMRLPRADSYDAARVRLQELRQPLERRERWLLRLRAESPRRIPLWAAHLG
jgi:hypothetical protein